MARGANMARGTRAHATRHARPHDRAARAHAVPRWRVAGADAWHGPHESAWTPKGASLGE